MNFSRSDAGLPLLRDKEQDREAMYEDASSFTTRSRSRTQLSLTCGLFISLLSNTFLAALLWGYSHHWQQRVELGEELNGLVPFGVHHQDHREKTSTDKRLF